MATESDEHGRQPRSLLPAVALANVAWLVTFFAFSSCNVFLMFGAALVCLMAAIVAHRASSVAALFVLLVSLPWLVLRERALSSQVAHDLNQHRWTAFALDGSLGSIVIATEALALAFVPTLAVILVPKFRPKRA